MKRIRHMRGFALLLSLAACSNPFAPSRPSIEYRVTGTASMVSVTYATAGGGTAQVGTATLPWSTSFKCEKAGDFLYVSAQNRGTTGTVTVTIYKDSASYKTTTSSGSFVIATAEGSC